MGGGAEPRSSRSIFHHFDGQYVRRRRFCHNIDVVEADVLRIGTSCSRCTLRRAGVRIPASRPAFARVVHERGRKARPKQGAITSSKAVALKIAVGQSEAETIKSILNLSSRIFRIGISRQRISVAAGRSWHRLPRFY